MKKRLRSKLEAQNGFVTKCILKGMTIVEIAEKLDCSTSTVSNRIKKIFKKYEAKNRSEFILNVLAEIIKKDRDTIQKKELQIYRHQEILQDLFRLKDNKEQLQQYIQYIEKIL